MNHGQDFRQPMKYDGYVHTPSYNIRNPNFANPHMIQQQMPANPFVGYTMIPSGQNQGYNPSQRETYSPDVKRSYQMEINDVRRHSTNLQQYSNYGWSEYTSYQQPITQQQYNSNVAKPVVSNEIKMNFNQQNDIPIAVQRSSSSNTDESDNKPGSDLNQSAVSQDALNKCKLSTMTADS